MAEKRKDSRGRNLRDGEDQRPDGSYRYRYTDKAGNRRAVYSWKLVSTDKPPSGKRDGLSLREKEKTIESDIRDSIDSHAAAKMTLNDVFKAYMEGKQQLKASTRTTYSYMYQHYVSDTIGKRKITVFRYSDIKNFYNFLITERGLQPNTTAIIHGILHPVFEMAVRDGYIRTNPTNGAMGEVKKIHDWTNPKRHALTIEEQEAFIDFVAKSNAYRHWLPLFTVFLGTGCRMGEVIGLRWCDCDFESRSISINHNLIYHVQDNGRCEMHITTPKTSAGCRTIPMLDEVRKALLQERLRQMQAGYSTQEIDGYSGFVFLNRNGHVHNPSTINQTIARICEVYNKKETEQAQKERRDPVLIRRFSAHNMRHTFCTRFCENETNIKVIQEIMGHSNISTTMNIYAEATESKKREAIDNLEGKIKIS